MNSPFRFAQFTTTTSTLLARSESGGKSTILIPSKLRAAFGKRAASDIPQQVRRPAGFRIGARYHHTPGDGGDLDP